MSRIRLRPPPSEEYDGVEWHTEPRPHSPLPTSFFLSSFFLSLLTAAAVGACSSDGAPIDCGDGKCDIGNGEFSVYQPGNRFGWGGQDEYLDEIQPILAKRCVACHGCSDSPCQLKLSSYEGFSRGSNADNIFAPGLVATDMTRLKDGRVTQDGMIDYQASEGKWRGRGYYSVVDQDPDRSLMTKLLTIADKFRETPRGADLKADTHVLYTETLETRTFECKGAQDVSKLSNQELQTRGMPFGLEPLEPGDFEKIVAWISRGAPGPSLSAQEILRSPKNKSEVESWEHFLNGKKGTELNLKRSLMARFLYEHMFFAHIAFSTNVGEFYEMVRSITPTGTPIKEIVTDYIMDDPDERVFYRFRKLTAIMVRKTHTVWKLNPGVMAHTEELFMKGITATGPLPYDVSVDPGYTHKLGDGTRNPFRYFSQIPGQIRAQFMIENSKKLIESLVKADVCTGSTATYAIRDHFWVWFLKPDSDPSATDTDTISEAFFGWNLNPYAIHSILETDNENAYQEAFEREMRILKPNGLSLDDIWTGSGGELDPNSWITVLRHDKSATVEWGAVGGQPPTGWLLSYSNFERLYYNLTVNFLSAQRAVVQLKTWTYFSNIRTEAEDLMLSLFPSSARDNVRGVWTSSFSSSSIDTTSIFDFIADIKEGTNYSMLPGREVGGSGSAPRESKVSFASDLPTFQELTSKWMLLVASRLAMTRSWIGTAIEARLSVRF